MLDLRSEYRLEKARIATLNTIKAKKDLLDPSETTLCILQEVSKVTHIPSKKTYHLLGQQELEKVTSQCRTMALPMLLKDVETLADAIRVDQVLNLAMETSTTSR